MFINLQIELDRIRQEVAAAIQEGNPTTEIRALLIMTTAWLGVIEMKVRKTRNMEERRELLNEFSRRKSAVEKAINAYRKETREGGLYPDQELRKAVS